MWVHGMELRSSERVDSVTSPVPTPSFEIVFHCVAKVEKFARKRSSQSLQGRMNQTSSSSSAESRPEELAF